MGRIKPSTLSGSFRALHRARTVLGGFVIFFLTSCFSHLLISFQCELSDNAKMPWRGGDIDINYLWKSKCFVRGHEHQVLRRKMECFCTFCRNQFVILPQMHVSSLSVRRDRHLHLFIYKALIRKLPPYKSALLQWSLGPYQNLLLAPTARNSLHSIKKVDTLRPYGEFESTILNGLYLF